MIINLISTKEILDFEKEIGIELEANERKPTAKVERFYVQFKDSSIMESGLLIGKYGNGNTIDEALIDYCRNVSYQRVAFNCYSSDRIEIDFPKLIHTKFINK